MCICLFVCLFVCLFACLFVCFVLFSCQKLWRSKVSAFIRSSVGGLDKLVKKNKQKHT